MAVFNAWLEYRRVIFQKGNRLSFSDFHVSSTNRGRPQSSTLSRLYQKKVTNKHKGDIGPSDDVRHGNISHPEQQDGHERRCKLHPCAEPSKIQCEKYQVPLCLSDF